ncbi:hypothetical protein SVIOM342S_04087 [Streptomyces violaceorubidus]
MVRYWEVVDCPRPMRRWMSVTQTPISTSSASWPGKLMGSLSHTSIWRRAGLDRARNTDSNCSSENTA